MQRILSKNILFILYFFITSFVATANDTLKVEIQAFNLTDLSSSVDETNSAIRLGNSETESITNVDKLFEDFKAQKKEAEEFLNDTSAEVWYSLGLPELVSVKNDWTNYEEHIEEINKKLTEYNEALEKYGNELILLEKRWRMTEELNQNEEAVEVVQERINSMIELISKEEENQVLLRRRSYALMDTVTREKIFITDQIERLKTIYDKKKELILVKDSPRFADMIEQNEEGQTLSRAKEIWRSTRTASKKFIKKNWLKLWVHLILTIFIIGFFYFLKKQLKDYTFSYESSLNLLVGYLKYPWVLGLLCSAIISFWFYTDMPINIGERLFLIITVLMTICLYSVLKRDYRLALILFAVLFFIQRVNYLLAGDVYLQRWLLMIEGIAGLAYTIYLSRPGSIIYYKQKQSFFKIVKFFPLISVAFAISIYANYTGSVILAKLINLTILKSTAIIIALYLFVTTIEGMIDYLLKSDLNKTFMTFKVFSDQINRWTRIILRIWAGYSWFMATLKVMQLKESFLDKWDEVMRIGWDFGEVSLNVFVILNFILIILIFSVVANISRALLEVELLTRLDLKKGIPMAIAVVTRYFILVLGFFMAVAAAGISLDKLGFLAGALGVGIGFGLQNIVGNFVSGLILIFERPIHIDDVIVTENIEGVVKEVGIRASKIRTWDGAEVIVPNMDLISRQVTNWTLSDTNRRRELILKMESHNDPNKVIDVIKKVIELQEEVLKDPGPMVLFLGYQQYSIDFRILFWLSGGMLQASSDVTLAIHNALKKEGIHVAIPVQKMIVEKDTMEEIKSEKMPGVKKKPAVVKKDQKKPGTETTEDSEGK